MVYGKKSYLQWHVVHFTLKIYNGIIISESYSLLTAWLHCYKRYGYYAPASYSLVLFGLLYYHRPVWSFWLESKMLW